MNLTLVQWGESVWSDGTPPALPELEDLYLGARAEKVLARAGVGTVEHLLTRTRDALLDTWGCGEGTASEIECGLARFGLRLKAG